MLRMKIKQNTNKALLAILCFTAATTLMANPSPTRDATPPYGHALKTVESVINALNNGAIVSAAVDLSKCTRQDGGTPSQTKGGLRVSPYRIKGDGTLSFADSHFTVSTSSGSPNPIMQFLRYSVNPEGAITVTSFIFSIPDYNLTRQVSFDCSINQGVNFNVAQ